VQTPARTGSIKNLNWSNQPIQYTKQGSFAAEATHSLTYIKYRNDGSIMLRIQLSRGSNPGNLQTAQKESI